MFPIVCRAYLLLISVDLMMTRGGFSAVHQLARTNPVAGIEADPATVETVCKAVDLASIWYWKQVSCLHRSVVAISLLRRRGIACDLVIGVQRLPFRGHAWVEVEGRVVNDLPYLSDLYAVIDRC